jgi:FlaA1/EpsC-like NDP-sugar epimerase
MQHLFEKYKPHYVYQTAAFERASIVEGKTTAAMETSVLDTEAIVDFSVKSCVEKNMLNSAGKAAYPTNAMAISKRIAEIYAQSLNKSMRDKDHGFFNGLSNNDRFVAMPMKQVLLEFKSKIDL